MALTETAPPLCPWVLRWLRVGPRGWLLPRSLARLLAWAVVGGRVQSGVVLGWVVLATTLSAQELSLSPASSAAAAAVAIAGTEPGQRADPKPGQHVDLAALALRAGRAIAPSWAQTTPRRELELDYDYEITTVQNGARLASTVNSLRAGDRLWIGEGIWTFAPAFEVSLQGTSDAPIWIEARAGHQVIITRADARQNVINVGSPSKGPSRFLCLRGLELKGGSAGLRLHQCRDVWIDGCEIHHTGEAGLTANTHNTDKLYITNNHVHHTAGYGEGMYLGANNGAVVMSRSVIAANHVHHCSGHQGDGIEIKQGSWGNWIVGNTVHHTQYPSLLVYGTGGRAVNVIESNILYGSEAVVLQVQGEALVRNNLVMGGAIGFHSHDHQGQTVNLQLVHNSIVVEGLGADLSSWNDRDGMVFANNAVYSKEGRAVVAEHGVQGVAVAGNVVFGSVQGAPATGFSSGRGLGDFRGLSWDGSLRDPRPGKASALREKGDRRFAVWADLFGMERAEEVGAGCAVSR